jgi:tetratricopeptide (TPR) repeat protein
MKCAARRVGFSFFLLLAVVIPVRADLIADGRAAFTKGDYAAATEAFRSALSTHGPSAGLYYNLALAEQKSGQRAQAALNLRRALMLDPRMTDARMALSEIERSQGVPPSLPDWREFIAEHAPLKTLLIAGCALAWLGAFLILFVVFARAGRLLPLAGAIGLLVLGASIFLSGYLADPRISESNMAVVSQGDGIPLLSAPADQSTAVTRLPAAASVRILQQRGEWTFCSAPNGEKGWAPSKSLEPIVPAA